MQKHSQPRKMHVVEQCEENDNMFMGTLEVEMAGKLKQVDAIVNAGMDNDKEKWIEKVKINSKCDIQA